MFDILEKKIRGKFIGLRNGTETPATCGIATLLNKMKGINEPFYDSLLLEYKNILENIKNKPPTTPHIPNRLLKK